MEFADFGAKIFADCFLSRTSRRASAVDNALADIGIDTADPEAFQYVPGIESGLPLMPTEGIHCALYQLRGHLYTFFELQVMRFDNQFASLASCNCYTRWITYN
eukprot:SAG31_NODE_101_length_25195_cov_67.436758_8_plen_104_part_00